MKGLDRGDLPNSKSSKCSACEKHAHIDGCRLHNRSDGDDNTEELHEAQAAKLVSNCGLTEGAYRFASNVNRDDLLTVSQSVKRIRG